uniref:C-type lectin domain-containing protein n=1 Tax=Mucochytrium quahogii TaxID=96639 RepID=A0A7S2RT45_9STRA|mmetsp:Transcript_32512/g.51735  ORF Transcript_32512/g.51735 Transcript_32512/m.51735 type:complete len:875 (-) Transcript_32512:1165-3789(-)|eukprot:CAMPEP_0203756260 /NCGR_PEP_ID=MMETSP0098-20131031/9560_1 /ASSEMBLY_ACC=CAM_ASM_000208 /TAXON_ID=96639 /ORGANISM=" , Strain NY0313808BC1" /LENGTH=874 /DNA_ID=CAMNT_0050648059 /DNA_START=313 /DNA_END=2937 /DNA_ORIENTATION=+
MRHAVYSVIVILCASEWCNGIGDEHMYLQIDKMEKKLVCTEAQFGARFPTVPALSKSAAVVTGCFNDTIINDCPSKPEDYVIILNKPNVSDKFCSLAKDLRRLVDVECKPAAVVVVNYDSNGTYTLDMSMYLNPENLVEAPPVCMISRKSFQQIPKATFLGSMHATVHTGATEEVYFHVNQGNGELFVDGVATKSGDVVPDTYQNVAFHVESTVVDTKVHFHLIFSDNFGVFADWKCTRQKLEKWNEKSFTLPDSGIEWEGLIVDKKMDIPDSKDSKGWKSKGSFVGVIHASIRELYCFKVKYESRIQKYGSEYFVVYKGNDNRSSIKQRCKDQNASLVEIHSPLENRLVNSLVPPFLTNRGVFIGLSDIRKEGVFEWDSGTAVEYTNWGAGEPKKHGEEFDCVVLRNSLWVNVKCSGEYAGVCERFVGSSQDQSTSMYKGSKCFVYLEDGPLDFNMFTQYPIELKREPASCRSVSHRSCCSADYIDKKITPMVENVRKKLKTEKCLRVLEQVMCFPCMHSQGIYTKFQAKSDLSDDSQVYETHLKVDMCAGTCISIWETCKDDKGFRGLFPDIDGPDAYCKALTNLEHAYQAFNITMSRTDDNKCFRIDGVPPKIRKLSPKASSEITADEALVATIQFSEQVRVNFGTALLYHEGQDRTQKGSHDIVGSCNLLSGAKLQSDPSSAWDQDTLEMRFDLAEQFQSRCLPDGEYHIVIPTMSITDTSGNAFPGTSSVENRWPLYVKDNFACTRRHRKSNAGWIVPLLLAFISVAGFLVYRRQRKGGVSNQYFDSIGNTVASVVSTTYGRIQGSHREQLDTHSLETLDRNEIGNVELDSNYLPLREPLHPDGDVEVDQGVEQNENEYALRSETLNTR